MRTCKLLRPRKAPGFFAALAALAALAVCAPSATLDFPSMPSVSSPSMPEIGGAPYVPHRSTNGGNSSSGQDSAQSDTGVKPSAAGLALSAENISELGGLEALGTLTGNGPLGSYLSALSGISGLSGSETLGEAVQAIAAKSAAEPNSAASKATNEVLSQILEQLRLIAEKEKSSTLAESGTHAENSATEAASQSKILRFLANGSDILGTCRTVYFSEPEANGVFLLTGDRVFHIGSQRHSETFYFLFKPQTSRDGNFFYDVEAELSQDASAPGSKLFPLAEAAGLTARRTGNLVTLRHAGDGWSLDILIDLRENAG